MPRSLTVLLRRDHSRDRDHHQTHYEGYQFYWPDGRALGTNLSAFCRHGQRLLGRNQAGDSPVEQFVEFVCFPLQSIEDPLTRMAGHRIRRFFLERTGPTGRLHFMDGTPTEVTFEIGRDEWPVLEWIGLPCLEDGGRQWLDLAVKALTPNPARAS